MTFLNPFALIGMIAAGIPLLLHLLSLRKTRVVEFSTLTFLKELQPTTLRRLRIRQILLLILRTLLVILLVLAFSRPTLKGSGSGPLGTRVKTTAVIAFDDSPSMERHDRNGALWKQAAAAGGLVLDQLTDGDEIILLPFSSATDATEAPALSSFRSITQARSALGELKPGTVSASLDKVLHSAQGAFDRSVNAQKELFLLSDFQEGLFSSEPQASTRSPAGGGNAVRSYAISVGEGPVRSLGITEARVVNSIVEQGKPFTLAVTLINPSSEDFENSVVSVFLNGTRVTAKAVDVRSGTSASFDIPVVAGSPGFVNGTVSVEDDDFPFDDVRHFSLHLRSELRVALLGPSASLRYLRSAIGTREAGGPTVQIEESTIDRLSGSLLRRTDVLIMANVSAISPAQASDIKAFLDAGGGMIFFPGPLTDGRSYQAVASPLGLPDFRGLRTIGTSSAERDVSAARFDEVDRRHPIFQQMFEPRVGQDGSRAGSRLESPDIWSHVVYGPSTQSRSVVSLTDGSPFLIDVPVGTGRVMLFAVEAEPGWSDLPFKGLFVPLLLRSLSYVAHERALMPQVIAGSAPPPLALDEVRGSLAIHSPGGNTIAVPAVGSGTDGFPLKAVDEIGIYDVTEGALAITRFAVNGAPEESQLRPQEPEQVGEAIAKAGFESADLRWIDEPSSLARLVTEARLGAELWHIAIIAALVVALLELVLGRAAQPGAEEGESPTALRPSTTGEKA